MKTEDILKQFKRIEADPTYTDYSRRAILASAQLEKLTVRAILMRVFEGAGSVALVGLLIFAIAGGFSGSKYLSPVQFSGIDPAALHRLDAGAFRHHRDVHQRVPPHPPGVHQDH